MIKVKGGWGEIRDLEWHYKTPSSILELQASWVVGYF